MATSLHQFVSLPGFLLAVAYSATIGGLATLVGTAPNIFVKGFVERYVLNYNESMLIIILF